MNYGKGTSTFLKTPEGAFAGTHISYSFLPKGEMEWRNVSFTFSRATLDVIGRVKHVLKCWENGRPVRPEYRDVKIDGEAYEQI